MTRIRSNLPIVLDSGMDGFVSDVLPLPLEFHEGFTRAKASLGRDREINAESTPMQVLHKICAELQQSIPPIWISFAADVSELHAARLDFVNGSSKVFSGRKDLLEKIPQYPRLLHAQSLARPCIFEEDELCREYQLFGFVPARGLGEPHGNHLEDCRA